MKLYAYFIAVVFLIAGNFDGVYAQYSGDPEILVAGDAVQIQIWDKPDENSGSSPIEQINGTYPIATDGTILLPFVGPVHVAGKSMDNVADIIKNQYADYLKEPFIFIRPLIRITLAGGVARPGSYRIDPKSSLWDLIDLAGGVTTEADLNEMVVVRGGKRVIDDLLAAFEKAYALNDVGIRSGDQIRIGLRSGFSIQKAVTWLNLGLSLVWLYVRITESK